MFLTVHATAGAIIGQATGNVWLGFLLGVISHFTLDAIPHGDENLIDDKETLRPKDILRLILIAGTDSIIMSGVLFSLFGLKLLPLNLYVLAGIIGAIIPDFFNGILLLLKQKYLKAAINFHFNLHFLTGKRVSFKTGLIIQLVTLFSLITILTIY